MTQQCTNCTQLEAEVKRLQSENARLRRIIEQAKSAASTIVNDTTRVLSQHQPRGTWGYAKGANEAAQKIARSLAG